LLAHVYGNYRFEISEENPREIPLIDRLFSTVRRAGLVLLSDLAKAFEELFAFASCLFKVSCLCRQVTLAFNFGVLQ
jgi:hypothetical protein